MAMINRNDIEKRLSDFCDIDEIANYLSVKERQTLFKISLQFAIDAVCHEQAGKKALGVNVAQSIVRNYWMSLLTGNAVKYLKKKLVKKPIILEMGMGSGLNAAAAVAINKDSYYIGVEINDLCIEFACSQFVKNKLEKKVEVIKGDYSRIKLDKKADIVINENFGPNLVEEEQIVASNAALSFSRKNAVFVPAGVNIFGIFSGKRADIAKLNFDKKIPLKLSFTKSIDHTKITELRPGCVIIDFQGKTALHQKKAEDYISYLPMIGEPIKIIKKRKKKLRFTLDFLKKQIIIE